MTIITRSIYCICYLNCSLFLLFSISIIHCIASDCLTENSVISDGSNNTSTLVSPGQVFELGFFAPEGNNNNRKFLGIWYYNQSSPRIIVWVANRNKPLLESNGSLILKDGAAKVLDNNDAIYWSTDVPAPVNSTLCLDDSGNLILYKRGQRGKQKLWQSFDYPTDTFLPGMDITEKNLTSWETNNNPSQGNYMLTLQIQGNEESLVILKKGSLHYWESEATPFDQAPQSLFNLLLNIQQDSYKNTRLVMNFTGQIQFWKWETERGWSLKWMEPKDRCSLYSTCGNFGSCNSNDGLCKCLPGFNASSPKRWATGNFSEGCSPKSVSCSRNYLADEFLRMPMMKVSTPKTNRTNVGSCKGDCLKECDCVAYSCGVSNCTGALNEMCLMWYYELTNLQEEYSKGFTIFVRSALSDIESTPRDCKPCGPYSIPYPLSTSTNCGDSSYFNFHCNEQIGQVNFSTSKKIFRVSSIDPDAKRFSIQVTHVNSCDSRSIDSTLLSPKDKILYSITNCKVIKEQPFLEVLPSFIEVELGWKPPPEPACNASSDCRDWPYTSCKKKRGGEMRCICGSKYHWDGWNLKCTKKVASPLKIVLPCIAGALAIVLICGILLKRRGRELGSVEFKGNDSEGIDVPFFVWESILAATNNFSDSNMLGKGGFGAVYEGMLPDGKRVAVKRLSSVSVQGVEEFRTEVELIAKLQHRNLVRLLGYCVKADEKILVYEYMPNGSLDSFLFDEACSMSLDWKKRFDIILGIARGLLYLHHDSRLRIIHRDLKPSNILLDEEFNPKISDFGIAKIVGGKETEASTNRVVGTYGYMSPEYAYEGLFSVKSDVFSFGVVILEILTGRRNSRKFKFELGASLLGHAWKLWKEDRQLEIVNQTLNDSCNTSNVMKCIHVGLLCVQEDPNDRPTMSSVFLMLSSENVCLPMPKQPAFVCWKPLSETASSSSLQVSSLNELTNTVSSEGR
ncbi:G-type lectin S-receptor-like serine/threonine-protein kinase At4g03230 isoform X3 [Amaranthus tricolor]|uniref:G-type lectin S-receptor-like serine/threonine-protein kinase At4g03230 isoform X3 n=2 Tax=Amaranthus tricolor TaxID=29722 RepID=UPI00258495A5|nr:G-type lectin S-receptor-like serine/threonine-protein kinase At4g03230 isoform X3 [Amaranthus tricolor]